jgi:hypothetical protein
MSSELIDTTESPPFMGYKNAFIVIYDCIKVKVPQHRRRGDEFASLCPAPRIVDAAGSKRAACLSAEGLLQAGLRPS